jgi:hypothetical protein
MKDIVLSSFKEKSKYIVFLLLFLFVYLIFTILLSTYIEYNENIEAIKNDDINKTLEVNINKEDALNYFEENSKVITYYPIFSDKLVTINGDYYNVNYNSDNYEILKGKTNGKGEIIVSEGVFNRLGLTSLNDTLTITYNNINYTFEVVGIIQKTGTSIYLNLDDFLDMFELEENKYYVVVKNHDDIENIIKELNTLGYMADRYDTTGETQIETIESLKTTYRFIILALTIILFIFLNITIKNILNKENKDIAIYKALGYKLDKILLIIFFRFLIILLFTLLIVSVIYIIYFGLIYQNISLLSIIISNVITTFIILGLIIINLIKYKTNIKKMNVFDILQEY